MKKLVMIFAVLGLMFQVAGCTGKKAQDDTEVVENADVEKVEAEEAQFAGTESATEGGPIDESLQAALGEAPQVDDVEATPTADLSIADAPTEVVNTETTVETDVAAVPAPSIDESMITETPVAPTTEVAANTEVDAGISETPVVETPTDTSQDLALTDTTLAPDTTASGSVTEMTPETTTAAVDTTIAETPVTETASVTPTETYVPSEASVTAEATQYATPPVAKSSANSNKLRKIAETTPYQHGDGYVNAVYIARPKEKLKDISNAIYGMDKTKELKAINSFLKGGSPKGGDKIYYISPNRPTDSTRMMSYYEDTGMIPQTYVAQKGDTLPKVAKNLLGYENAWKEIWTTNAVESKAKLTAGETLRYWKPSEPTMKLAQNTGNSQLVDSAQQLPPVQNIQPPPPQEVAMNAPPPPQEMAPPPAQELPPPPSPPDMNASDMAAQQAPPPPPDMNAAPPVQEMAPPPPPPQEVAAVPPPPPPQQAVNMEEEAMGDGMNEDTTMMLGVVAVLVAVLGMVLVRRNKKKKEAEMASIEQTHVGS